ncbi:N-terminal region of Chorein, a TM vesicle-mediated sorter-domain-containing protein [Pavlovales sp. CCMP2436]|nr:N-terminal region of Chorein, a TM vesicle-mediated sorter-domain-containing protein [Pavlovales sp. CCMP2436]
MLEGWIAGILEETTRAYIRNLPREKLRVDFRRGNLELENLELKSGPIGDGCIAIRTGLIRRVLLDIPWSNLSGASVKMSIDGVYVLLCPANEFEEQTGAQDAGAKSHHLGSPAGPTGPSWERAALAAGAPAGAPTTSRFMQWMTSSVELCITNVMVRLESAHGGAPGAGAGAFGICLTIAEFSYGTDSRRAEAARAQAIAERTRPAAKRFTKALVAKLQVRTTPA